MWLTGRLFILPIVWTALNAGNVITAGVEGETCNCTIRATSYGEEDVGYDKVWVNNSSHIYINGERVVTPLKNPPTLKWWSTGLTLVTLRWHDNGCYVNNSVIFDMSSSTSESERLQKIKKALSEVWPGDVLVGVTSLGTSEIMRLISGELSKLGILLHHKRCERGDEWYRSAIAFVARVGAPTSSQFIQALRGNGPVTLVSSICPLNLSSQALNTSSFGKVKIYDVRLQGGVSENEGVVNAMGADNSTWLIGAFNTSDIGSAKAVAKVVCTELGFSAAGDHTVVPEAFFRAEFFSQRLLEVQCRGNETALTDCPTLRIKPVAETNNCYTHLSIRCAKPVLDVYPFGYPAWRRPMRDSTFTSDSVYLFHPRDRLTHEGYVTGWNFFPVNPGIIYLQVWRKVSYSIFGSRNGYFFLVGQTEVVVSEKDINKLYRIHLSEEKKIPFQVGDDLGFYTRGKVIIPFSIMPGTCLTPDRVLYNLFPGQLYTYRQLYFRHTTSMFSCRIYSVYATVHNTTVMNHVTMPRPTTTPRPTPPSNLDVRLMRGRLDNEGLVQVSISGTNEWGYVCGRNWGKDEATVVCKQKGYAGGIPRYIPFFGVLNSSEEIFLQVGCTGKETSLAECEASYPWRDTGCFYTGAGVECIPRDNATGRDQANRTRAFGYPAVRRRYNLDYNKQSAILLNYDGGFPQSGSVISSFTIYVMPKSPWSKLDDRHVYIQIWRYHGKTPPTKSQDNMDVMLVNQIYVDCSNRSGVVEIKVDPPMVARSGDMLGLYFPDVNFLAYDTQFYDYSSTYSWELKMDGHGSTMAIGRVYTFSQKGKYSCPMFSVYAKYHLQDDAVKSSFSFEGHYYVVYTDVRMGYNGAKAFCKQEIGMNWSLAEIESQAEMDTINDALNTIYFNTTVQYWINTDNWKLHADNPADRPYTKWGFCQPGAGMSCAVLSNYHHGSGEYSGLDFHMYSRNCFGSQAFPICKHSPGDNTAFARSVSTPDTTTAVVETLTTVSKGVTDLVNSTSQVQKQLQQAQGKLGGGSIAGIVIGIVLTATAVFLAVFFILRRQKHADSHVRLDMLDAGSTNSSFS